MPSPKRSRQRANSQARSAAMKAQQRRAQQRRQAIVVAVLIVAGAAVVFLLRGGNKSKVATKPTSSTTTPTPTTTPLAVPVGAKITGATPCPAADGSAARTTSFASPPPTCIDPAKSYTATITTDVGKITIALDPAKAPATVNNFVVLARYHFYDGVAFHRVIPDFMNQGGDLTGTGTSGPGYTFADELPAAGAYKAGSLAMANSGPNTNGSQFFIVASDNGAKTLQPNYTLFGQVSDGMDVVTKINNDGTSGGTPKVPHKMLTVTIAES